MAKANPLRFSTKYQDDETDLLYYGYRYYNASTGRWMSRDPIEEKGGLNLYALLGNEALGHIDGVGRIKVVGCGDNEDNILEAFRSYCEMIKSAAFKCCLGHFNIPARLQSMCERGDDYTVKCESKDSGFCNGACGWSLPGGKTIHVCPIQWTNPGCGDVGCTLMHELTHMMGHPGEKWPTKVHKCLGCP